MDWSGLSLKEWCSEKPKPLFQNTNHSYIKDGVKWFTTAKPGTNMGYGTKWVKEIDYDLEIFWGLKNEQPYIISGNFNDMTPEKARKISLWFEECAKWLEFKGPKKTR